VKGTSDRLVSFGRFSARCSSLPSLESRVWNLGPEPYKVSQGTLICIKGKEPPVRGQEPSFLSKQ
jgi:hypothetical protein